MLDFDAIMAGGVRGTWTVAVTGGRMFGRVHPDTPPEALAAERRRAQAEIECVQQSMDAIHAEIGIGRLVVGDAKGLDELARIWAVNRKITVQRFRADWDKEGRKAGVLRNLRMLKDGRPEYLVSFPGGNGTAHMTRICREAKIPIIMIPKPESARS